MQSEFKAPDGKTYTLSPLTFGDQREFKHFVQYRAYYAMLDYPERFPADKREAMLAQVFNECVKNPPQRYEINAALYDEDGGSEMLYMSLRKHHKITREEVQNLITFDNFHTILDQLYRLSGMIEEKKDEPKTTAKKNTRSTKA